MASYVELEFNEGRNHDDEIRHMLPNVKYVMNAFDIAYINSAHNLEDVITLTLEPSDVSLKHSNSCLKI